MILDRGLLLRSTDLLMTIQGHQLQASQGKTDLETLYVDSVRVSMANEGLNTRTNKINAVDGIGKGVTDLLHSGLFQTMDGEPTLPDILKWSVSPWKNTFAVNTNDKGNNLFLFEILTKQMAEHVPQGEWRRKKKEKIPLEWWHPSFGCRSDRQERR